MSKIRETVITNCERKFLNKCLSERTRLDGRSFDEFRPLKIRFGKDWGCCYVSLGETRVLAQTSCEIQQPKSSRPSEGILYVNIELNPLAAPHFEPGRQSELSVQLNRLLEKCIKDFKAVDLESLCIKTNEKVWALRVDINVLNHEGNILDCASVALLTSLAHFRRPDVTCDGEEFIIHTYQQRDPIVTVMNHYPVCITYCIFNGGEYVFADPSLLEEGCADALLIIGLNSFKELCGLHLGGKAELTPTVILNTVSRGTKRATKVVEEIKAVLLADNEARQKGIAVGFHVEELATTALLGESIDYWQKKNKKKKKKNLKKGVQELRTAEVEQVEVIGRGSAAYASKVWEVEDSDDDLIIIEKPGATVQVSDSDSEENDIIILEGGTHEESNLEH